jgi:mono/diheme cytochrome c family protein
MRSNRAAFLAAFLAAATAAPAAVDFNREVRPILSDNCFKCHGPDEASRKARLRLDVRDAALAPAKSGLVPIVPGQPADSELLARLTDMHEPMPPADSSKKLTAAQIDTLRRWVAEGAPYAPHWSFVAPVPARIPTPTDNPIDGFVRSTLAAHQLAPAREADPATLLRRVSLDLTGVPPSLAELDAFLADRAPGGYERAVDRLLASPRFGERMAVDWLDAARYADTNGFFRGQSKSANPKGSGLAGCG